jgi:hypothetical protein
MGLMIDYKRYVILLGFDNTIKSSKEVFPFLMSGTDLNNALRHFLDFECGIPFHKTDNLTTYELVSKIPQMVLSIYELKPDNMIYFGDNKNEPTNKDETESIKDVKTAPVIVRDKYEPIVDRYGRIIIYI